MVVCYSFLYYLSDVCQYSRCLYILPSLWVAITGVTHFWLWSACISWYLLFLAKKKSLLNGEVSVAINSYNCLAQMIYSYMGFDLNIMSLWSCSYRHVQKCPSHWIFLWKEMYIWLNSIFLCLFSFFQRVLKHEDNSTLLRSYISEWSKFFTQCSYLPKPFNTLESNLQGKAGGGSSKRPQNEQSTVQKVGHSLHGWFLCSVIMSWIVPTPFVYPTIKE